MFRSGDIVLVDTKFIKNFKPVHVKLIKKDYENVWVGKLIKKKEIDFLKKRYCIPYKYPNNVDTSVNESDIIKKVN